MCNSSQTRIPARSESWLYIQFKIDNNLIIIINFNAFSMVTFLYREHSCNILHWQYIACKVILNTNEIGVKYLVRIKE